MAVGWQNLTDSAAVRSAIQKDGAWDDLDLVERYPDLASSARGQWVRWAKDLYQRSTSLDRWIADTYPARGDSGFAISVGLVEMLVFNPKVQALADHHCQFLFPFLWDSGSPDTFASDGAKVRFVGPALPAVLAGFGEDLTLTWYLSAHEGGGGIEGAGTLIFPRSTVRRFLNVKVGKLLGGAPGLQGQITDPDDGGRLTITLLLNDLIDGRTIEAIRCEVIDNIYDNS